MYKDFVICFYMLISEQGMTPIGGLINMNRSEMLIRKFDLNP